MMRRTHGHNCLATWTVVTALTAGGQLVAAPQAEGEIQRVTESIRRAEALAQEAESNAALDLLEGLSSEDREAAALLEYARGWLHQRLAGEEPDNYARHIARAIERFEAAVDLLNDNTQAERVLYAARLGAADHYARGPQGFSGAFDQYQKAFRQRPDDDRAPLRLVALYPLIGEDTEGAWEARWTERFLDTCAEINRAGHRPAASRGYASIIHKGTPEQAEEALVRWVEIEGEQRTLDPAALERLPIVRPQQGLSELERLAAPEIEHSALRARELKFWAADERHQHVIAAALASFGKNSARSGNHVRAEWMYRQGREVAPRVELYQEGEPLAGRPIVGIELAAELAALYNAHPKLDDGGEFQALQDELLNEKSGAYLRHDLPAMQQFHTVLGVIFASEARWGRNDLRQAPYHLERAVEVAQRVEGREASEYQPLPRLTQLLAEGLRAREPAFARDKYLEAAMGYVDESAFKDAEAMVKSAAELTDATTDAVIKQKIAELRGVIQMRRDSPTLGLERTAEGILGRPRDSEVLALSPVFVDRQIARVYADLREQALARGDAAGAREFQDVEAARTGRRLAMPVGPTRSKEGGSR